MIDKTAKNYLMKYTILERDNEKNKIALWPDAPFWLFIENNALALLNCIDKKSFADILTGLKETLGAGIDEGEVLEFLNLLYEAEVLTQDTEQRREQSNYYRYALRYLTLNITNNCNLFCKHCYIDASQKKKDFMTLENIKHILTELKPFMIKSCSINVSGGEALVNPQCMDILRHLNSEGLSNINIVTNGTLISDYVIESFKQIRGLSVQVSLDGATKSVHEAIRGKDTYAKTINHIQKLSANSINVSLPPIVTEDLFNEIEAYFLLAKELGVKSVFLQPINEVGRAKDNKLKRVDDAEVFAKFIELYEKYPDFKDYIPGSLDVQHLTSIKLLEKCLYCGSGVSSLAVQPNGDCFPCPNTIVPSLKICNLLTDGFKKYWFDSPALIELRSLNVNTNLPSKCSQCDVKHFCGGGCRGVALQHTGQINGLSPVCEFSKKRLLEMLWVAAAKPHLFEYDVQRKIKLSEKLSDELQELIDNNKTFASGM